MERFSRKINDSEENKKVDRFLSEIHAVCKKHGLCIEHEDSHGSFIIESYSKGSDFDWLNDASVGESVE